MTRMSEAELEARGLTVAREIGRRGVVGIPTTERNQRDATARDVERQPGRPRATTAVAPEPVANRGNKYGAVATDGPDGAGGTRRYPSKKGARLAHRLEGDRLAGAIVSWAPEISIPVGTMGTRVVRHLVDALAVLEVYPDGSFRGRFVEAKGFRVRSGEKKRRAVEDSLKIKVQVV